MRSYKKIAGFIIILVTAILLMYAYKNDHTPKFNSNQIDWHLAKDDPNERLSIKWMGPPYCGNASEGTYIEKTLETRFNIEIKPVFLDLNSYQQTKPLMLAAGMAPDMWWEADPVTLQQGVKHGLILELPYEVIRKYAPDYADMINNFAPQSWLFSNVSGKNYGVPTIWTEGIFSMQGLWRKDWLENVGINRVPQTLDEMYIALYRFRHNDPDGNSRKDTYGLTTNYNWWWLQFSEIYGAFGVLPYNWMLRDGKIVWGGTLAETKNALKLLRKWYADEIIEPDFITHNNQDITERAFVSGKIGYAYGATSHGTASYLNLDKNNPSSLINQLVTLNPAARVAIAVHPFGPGGKHGAHVWGGGGNIHVFSAKLANEPQKVIRILKIWEQMCTAKDLDLFLLSKTGKRGFHWDYRDRKNPSSGIELLPPFDNHSKATAETISPYLSGGQYWNPCGPSLEILEKFRSAEYNEFNHIHRNPENGLKDIFLKPDVVKGAAKYLDSLRNIQKTVFAEIIRGDKSLSAFDDFVELWYRRGGAEMTRQANDLYIRMKDIYKKTGIEK